MAMGLSATSPAQKLTLLSISADRGDINRCWYLVTSGRRTPEGEGERSQMIGWDSFPSAEVNNKKVSFWAGLVADRPLAIYSGLKTKEYLRHEEPQVLQASVKK